MRIQCALIKGNVYQYLNWPEEAVRAWHEAVQGSEALGWHQMAAFSAATEAIGWSARLARPDEALAALAPYLEQDLAPPVRRHVLMHAGFVTASIDPDRAKVLLDEAQQIRWRPRDLQPMLQEAGDSGASLRCSSPAAGSPTCSGVWRTWRWRCGQCRSMCRPIAGCPPSRGSWTSQVADALSGG